MLRRKVLPENTMRLNQTVALIKEIFPGAKVVGGGRLGTKVSPKMSPLKKRA
jgi:hypothetical protein